MWVLHRTLAGAGVGVKEGTTLRFGTLCSGIEGAAVAFQPFGWELAFSSEIDPFCCALLDKKYPGVPNHGDITNARIPCIDLIVSGTPCQSFSVNGKRAGMDDPRGQLAQRFTEILCDIRPRWVVWENVPGVLSSNGGRDFGAFIGALDDLGYGVAWRVLDARYFGVSQRRRRVFVVGCYRDWRRAAVVLTDSPARRQHASPSRKVRQGANRVQPVAGQARFGWTGDETPKFDTEACPTLRAFQGGEGVGVISESEFRRLTIDEWETLQGFPRGYTDIDGASDSARRRAIGNAFCVPVMRWIGQRIGVLHG